MIETEIKKHFEVHY